MQNYDQVRTGLAPTRRERGWYQDEVSRVPLYNGLSLDEKAAVNAFLNPGHGTNCIDARPLPDGTPGKVFVFKSQWSVPVVASGTDVQFLALPFFEAPFAVAQGGGTPYVVQSPLARLPGQDNSSGYLDGNGVYAYRMLGKSMTIDNTTVVVGLSGESLSIHKTKDVDFALLSLTDGQAGTVDTNRRIIQRVPLTMEQLSAVTGSVTTQQAQVGVYGVCHHENMDFTTRDIVYKKTPGYSSNATNNLNSSLYYTQFSSSTQISCPLLINGAQTGSRSVCSFPDNGDVVVTSFAGLTSPTRFVAKFTMIYELILKADSPLWLYAVDRPPCNMALMQALHAYEQYRCTLPGSGTMPADANFFNEIWEGFKKYVLPIAGPVVSTLVPGLSGPIKALTSAISPSAEPEKLAQRAVTAARVPSNPAAKLSKPKKAKKVVKTISGKKLTKK